MSMTPATQLAQRSLTAADCSINTATLGHAEPIGTVIERVAKHGFGGISPWRRDLEGHDVLTVARQIRDAGLSVSGYCRSTYLTGASRAERQQAFRENRQAIEDAAALGSACFVLVVGGLPAGSRDLADARRQVEDGVAELLEHARLVGVPLALEPLHPMYAGDRSCLTSLAEAIALCERLDRHGIGGLGVAVDAYHVWWDWRVLQEIRATSGRLLAFHVCDWLVPTRDMLLDRGLMGDGVIDLKALRSAVEEANFNGMIEVEIFSEEIWRWDPEIILSRCVERVCTAC